MDAVIIANDAEAALLQALPETRARFLPSSATLKSRSIALPSVIHNTPITELTIPPNTGLLQDESEVRQLVLAR